MDMDFMSVAAVIAILIFIYKIVELRSGKKKDDKSEEKTR